MGIGPHCLLDCRAVDTLRLRFPDSNQPDANIGPGLHGIGRMADGALALVTEGSRMLAQLLTHWALRSSLETGEATVARLVAPPDLTRRTHDSAI